MSLLKNTIEKHQGFSWVEYHDKMTTLLYWTFDPGFCFR